MSPFEFDLDTHVHKIQRRPGHLDFVMNDGNLGLLIVDARCGLITSKLRFCDSYATSGLIDAWCLRADGEMAIAFNDKHRTACGFSFLDAATFAIPHPPWRLTTGMPYDWIGDTLWLKDPETHRFASCALHDDGTISLVERDGFDVLQANREWRRAVDQLRWAEAGCFRVETDRARMLYAKPGTPDGLSVGIAGWQGQPRWDVPAPVPHLGHLAANDQQLIVLQEYEALIVDENEGVLRRFCAPEGFQFFDLDTIPAEPGHSARLVIGAHPIDGRALTRFVVYSLQDSEAATE